MILRECFRRWFLGGSSFLEKEEISGDREWSMRGLMLFVGKSQIARIPVPLEKKVYNHVSMYINGDLYWSIIIAVIHMVLTSKGTPFSRLLS